MVTEIASGYQIDGTTITLTNGNILTAQAGASTGTANTWTALQTFSSGLSTSAVKNTAAQTTITGITAGSLVASMPEQGSSYKKVIVYANGYENDTGTANTYTFPVAFTNTPVITVNSANIAGVTVSTTALSIDPDNTTVYTGWIIVEGY